MAHLIVEKILVAVDFSENSEFAVEQAIHVAAHNEDAEIVLLWVDSKVPNNGLLGIDALEATVHEAPEASRRVEAQTRLGVIADRVAKRGIPVSARIEGGYADETIVDVAREIGAALIVVGTRGLTGFKRLLLGSVAEKVVRTSSTSVLVTRGEVHAFTRMLVAVDFSPASEHALQVALAMAAPDAHIDLVHAWQYPPGTRGMTTPDPDPGPLADIRKEIVQRIDKLGEALCQRYKGPGRTLAFTHVFGAAASVLHERMDASPYDLVAMGTHGHRGFRRFILGSVAEATVRHAPCSVLVTHDLSSQPSD